MHTHLIIATVRLDASTKPGPFNYIYKHSLRALAVSLEQTLRDTLLCVCVSVREGGRVKEMSHPSPYFESLDKVVLEGKCDSFCVWWRMWLRFILKFWIVISVTPLQLYVSCWWTLFSSSLFCLKWFRSVWTDGHRAVSEPGDTDLNPVSANEHSADMFDCAGSWDAAFLTSDLEGKQTEALHLVLRHFFLINWSTENWRATIYWFNLKQRNHCFQLLTYEHVLIV